MQTKPQLVKPGDVVTVWKRFVPGVIISVCECGSVMVLGENGKTHKMEASDCRKVEKFIEVGKYSTAFPPLESYKDLNPMAFTEESKRNKEKWDEEGNKNAHMVLAGDYFCQCPRGVTTLDTLVKKAEKMGITVNMPIMNTR